MNSLVCEAFNTSCVLKLMDSTTEKDPHSPDTRYYGREADGEEADDEVCSWSLDFTYSSTECGVTQSADSFTKKLSCLLNHRGSQQERIAKGRVKFQCPNSRLFH